MRDAPSDMHDWFRRRLDAAQLGLLDEDESRRFHEHASTCVACGELLTVHLHRSPSPSDSHIPARIIARWDRAQSRLRGLPRQLVREHLASCEECRQDLETLGFRPELPVVDELEGAAGESEEPPSLPASPHRIVVMQGRSRNPWLPWTLGGVIGAAVAAAALFVTVPGLNRSSPSLPDSNGTMAPVREPVAVAVPETDDHEDAGIYSLPPAATLRGPTRSSGESVTRVHLSADGRFMHLRLPELYLPDTTRLVVQLRDAGGRKVLERNSTYGDLRSAGTLVLSSPEGAFTTGAYRVAIAGVAGSQEITAPVEFRLDVTR